MSTPGLLILEGNADRLAREGAATLVDNLLRRCDPLVRSGDLRVKRIPFRTRVDVELAMSIATWGRFDAVLLVAHGNLDGAEAAADVGLTWAEIGSALAPVEPKALLAISCMANSSEPARALFEGAPTLETIGGSPVTLTMAQAELAFVELLVTALGRAPTAKVSGIVSLLNAGATGGLVGWRRRGTFMAASREDHLVMDVLAVLAHAALEPEPPRRRRPARRKSRAMSPPRRAAARRTRRVGHLG